MGVMDKMKFWKKSDDDLGDLGDFSDLGDFGTDNKPSTERESVSPSPQSMQLSQDMGLPLPTDTTPSPSMDSMAQPPVGSKPMPQQPAQQTSGQIPQRTPVFQQPQQQSYSNYDTSDVEKDMQIVLARLDAIRSSLDNINRRLDNLERMADGKQRYQW